METIFPGIYKQGKSISTKAQTKGSIYGEEIKEGYRSWDPYRSKFAAAVLNGLKTSPFKENSNVLYLGASTGTTVSHISDILTKGTVYALEFSETSMRKLLGLSKRRNNIVPLLQDARLPENYQNLVGFVDVIYQDVAQPDQSKILATNSKIFLKKNDYAVLCVKARSINSVKDPESVFKEEEIVLKKSFDIIQKIGLMPYDKDHRLYLLRFKGT